MQFLSHTFSKNTYLFVNLSKEIVIAIILVILPIFYPNTAEAGISSFIYNLAGDKVSAETPDTVYAPNSQNMTVLKAVTNSDPNPNAAPHTILASSNALVAEIGPAGTAADLENDVNTEISLYVVRSGDNLATIAEMFDVSVNTIVWANDLVKGEALKEGRTLVILPITGIQYVVKKGDTLKSVVAKFKADLDEVLQYNGLTVGSTLVVGSTIVIPDAEPSTIKTVKTDKGKTTPKLPTYVGYYTRPIIGGHKSQGIHGHNGVDLAAPVGTPIYAAAGGTVIVSLENGGWHGGYGNYVIISHPNGTQTLYAHNLLNTVDVGQVVRKGDMIGKIGMTGKTTGPHVHFEIRGAANPF